MHLHTHSNYSVIDGKGLIKDYVDLAVQDGQEFIALTDHGTLAGAIEFYQAAKKAHIKPIIGQEMYVDVATLQETKFPGHLTVLARNEDGYRALITANNLAQRQFYYRPRITLQQIIERGLARDWIILSGCQSSPLYDRPHSEAVEIIKQLASHSGGFFLEFMKHESNDPQFEYKQQQYLEKFEAFRKATGLPAVVTNDCHYSHQHIEEIHHALMQKSREPEGLEFDGTGFYFKTINQMEEIAKQQGIGDAVENAHRIAEMCDIVIPEADKVNWYVPDITGGKPEETLQKLCREALGCQDCNNHEQGYCPADPEYIARYEYEFEVLKTSPAILNSYLVTYDLVSWCRSQGIPVAARGSMAGSLCSYLLGITLEDPIKYKLSFSRAVNPARPTIPDFDLDVSSIHRQSILNYLKERYENNAGIAAYAHYGPKGALRKVLRMEALREFQDVNEMCKLLPADWAEGDLEYSPQQHRYVGKVPWFELVPEQYRDDMAIYQGLYAATSAHPSGVLVAGPDRPIEHEVPFQWIASSSQLVSAFDMYTLKKLGLFKLDVLGLSALDQLAAMERITGAKLPDDNYDDKAVLMAFGNSQKEGFLAEIFQMDGYACRQVLTSINGTQSFEDIIAANTLARPGCAQFTPYYRGGYTGLLQQYPEVADILEPSNGLILYQEQVMEIARVMADFDDAEQDDVKEAIKYFRHEVWSGTIEPKFRTRVEAKGQDPTAMLAAIAQMASYTYNRAHAMTYAAIAYKMMWYKVYYPAAFYAAVYDDAEDKQRLLLESQFFKVKWHPPDVNHSEAGTTIKDNEIYLGLTSIKGVGPASAEAIIKERPFTDEEDFLKRVEKRKCNKAVVAKMKEAFAFTSLGVPGKYTAFAESLGFNYRYLDQELVQRINTIDSHGTLAGFIHTIRPFKVASKLSANYDKEMCRLDVMNSKGKKRCVIFPDVWSKAKGKIYTGQAIIFYGDEQVGGDFIVQSGEAIE